MMAHNQYNQYYHYQGQHQASIPTDPFTYHHDPHQPKTPSTLDGLSPGPLRPLRTPPLSRDPSQAPQQPPDQMMYDEPESSSNSDTSARTPDNTDFDTDMLDEILEPISNFAPAEGLAMGATHGPQGGLNMPMPIMSDQQLVNALQETLTGQYQHTFSVDHQQPHMLQSQLLPHQYIQDYTNQSYHQDPWNVQAPLRGPSDPRSSAGMFDPVTDPTPYGDFVNNGSGWSSTINNPNTHYMLSSVGSTGHPSNQFFYNHGDLLSVDTYLNHSPVESHVDPSPTDLSSNYSPLEMRSSGTSPSPDAQNFVNLTSNSTYFAHSYHNESHVSHSRGTSVMGHAGLSPYQNAISPQTSIPSPTSGAMLSYRHSDPTLLLDACPPGPADLRSLHPPSPLHLDGPRQSSDIPSQHVSGTSSRLVREVTVDQDSEPDVIHARPSGPRGSGGRRLGTHLPADTARAANDMRKITACWHCVLQRDKCGPGDICERCQKRSQRPNADCGLGCSRIKLVELAEQFLPTLIMHIHENTFLMGFAERHILNWLPQEIIIKMTCGQRKLPRFEVRVYEFNPRDRALLEQLQYNTNPKTMEREKRTVMSPPLGMQQINHSDEKRYEKYIDDIVDKGHLSDFAELCWMEDDNDFQERLFRLMFQMKPKRDDEAKLLRECLRLIVCTFIMAHTISMAEEHKAASLERLHAYISPQNYMPKFTSPRLTNRQLKYFFARLQRNILCNLLNKLQQIFKSSKGCDKWLAAFLVVIGMAMAHEDQQKTLHCVQATKAHLEKVDEHVAQDNAIRAARDIDDRMHFIFQIFRWKYNRRHNPLRDADHDWEGEAGFGDANSVNFVRQVAQLVLENIDYLQGRQQVGLHPDNQAKYTSRLVGRFLLSFWLPQ